MLFSLLLTLTSCVNSSNSAPGVTFNLGDKSTSSSTPIPDSIENADKTPYTKRFTLKVKTNIPIFNIEVLGTKDSSNYTWYEANKIIISQNEKIYQEINLPNREIFGYPRTHDKNFCYFTDDMNFDGLNDFGIISFEPMDPNSTYLCYLWDEKSEKFVENTDLEEVPNPVFDQKTKLVSGSCRNSAIEHQEFTYKYIDDKLTLIERVDLGYPDENNSNNLYDFTYKLVNGEMKLVSKVITSMKDNI